MSTEVVPWRGESEEGLNTFQSELLTVDNEHNPLETTPERLPRIPFKLTQAFGPSKLGTAHTLAESMHRSNTAKGGRSFESIAFKADTLGPLSSP
ncbi:hypothetical protein Aduo_013203 [Ancylostoma duodenale]